MVERYIKKLKILKYKYKKRHEIMDDSDKQIYDHRKDFDSLFEQYQKQLEKYGDLNFTMIQVDNDHTFREIIHTLIVNQLEQFSSKCSAFRAAYNWAKFSPGNYEPTVKRWERAPSAWSSFMVDIIMCKFH